MPIYEYVCTTCDHRSDILHGINDPVPRFCLSCGREGTMRKLFAPPVIHYRGSGWAKKDRGGSSRASSSSASSASSASSGDAAGSDGKAEGATSDSPSVSSPSTPPSPAPGD